MGQKRLAMTRDGKLTYCTADDENIGKGICNHVGHQGVNETKENFLERATAEIEANRNAGTETEMKGSVFAYNKCKSYTDEDGNAKWKFEDIDDWSLNGLYESDTWDEKYEPWIPYEYKVAGIDDEDERNRRMKAYLCSEEHDGIDNMGMLYIYG